MAQAVLLLLLCLCVVVSELLARHTALRLLGAALLVIVLGTTLANLHVIPAGSSPERPVPAYAAVFRWGAPLSIFWLLLQVELRKILEAGLPMILLFCVGALATMLGAVVAMKLILGPAALGQQSAAVAGMFVGTYTGGSIAFNALALHYGVVEQGLVFAGAVVVDNVLTTVWMVATLLAPRLLARVARRPPGERGPPDPPVAPDEGRSKARALVEAPPATGDRDAELLGPTRLAAMLALGMIAVLGSEALAVLGGRLGLELPSLLILTVLALILAQLRPLLARLGLRLGLGERKAAADPFVGARALGMFAVYLFLAVVGAHADLAALWAIGQLGVELTILAGTTILVHGVIVFGLALLLRLDLGMAAVASQANIGGGTTALALARGLERDDLVAPGILVGALGTGLGTFLGFWIAGLLM